MRGHEPAERANDSTSQYSGNDESERSHSPVGGDFDSSKYEEEAAYDPRGDICGTDVVRASGVISVGHERREDVALDGGQICVEVIFQAGHGNGFAYRSGRKQTPEQYLLVRLQLGPFRAIFLDDKVVILVVHQAEQAIFLVLFNGDVAADRQVHDGRGDVAHIGRVIHKGANFPGRELIWWLVLCGDRAEVRVAAVRPPQVEHHHKRDDGNTQRPIAAQDLGESARGSRFVNEALVEGDSDRQSFVQMQRLASVNFDAVSGDFDVGILGAGAVGSGKDVGANIRHTFGQNNARAGGLHGNVPLRR